MAVYLGENKVNFFGGVDVPETPTPPGLDVYSGVVFIDYDGEIVEQWLISDVASKTALPSNPDHSSLKWGEEAVGLTAQGWNWTLADIKTYVQNNPDTALFVGQMYTTDNGETRFLIKLSRGRLSPYLGFALNGTATVSWGDGTTSTVTGTSTSTVVSTQHTYATEGEYVIRISSSVKIYLSGGTTYSKVLWKTDETANTYDNSVYGGCIEKAQIGNATIDGDAFNYCLRLETISIPSNVNIGARAFQQCLPLKAVVIPTGTTQLQSAVFSTCEAMRYAAIPNSITKINANAFNYCHNMVAISIPTKATSIANTIWQQGYSLSRVTIPSTVTNLGAGVFRGCYTLAGVTIPSGVPTINNNLFNLCYGLGYIKFTATIPPTCANSAAFTGIPTDCKILVPAGTLNTYKNATNYPSPSTYTYEEY